MFASIPWFLGSLIIAFIMLFIAEGDASDRARKAVYLIGGGAFGVCFLFGATCFVKAAIAVMNG
jgi:uncharacterized membrane protein YdcZ (DUF606 family)